jgi:hypothetical protein
VDKGEISEENFEVKIESHKIEEKQSNKKSVALF